MMELSDHLNQKGFHCAHLNSRSLFNKLDIVSQMLHYTNLKLHILGISETWLNGQIIDNFVNIEGYDLLRLDRTWAEPNSNTVKRGGGVSLYIRNTLSWKDDKVKFLNRSENFLEIQWLKL